MRWENGTASEPPGCHGSAETVSDGDDTAQWQESECLTMTMILGMNVTNPFTGFTTTPTATTVTTTATSTLSSMDISGIGSMVGHGLGGGVAAFFSAGKIVQSFKDAKTATVAADAAKAADASAKVGMMTKMTGGIKGMLGGFKAALPAIGKGVGLGAAVSGIVSAGVNGYRAFVTKDITTQQAVGNVVADSVTGGITSLGALGLSAGVVALAGTALAGLPLTILGIGAGIAGALLTDRLVAATGLRDGIAKSIGGGTTATPTSIPTPTPAPIPTGGNF